MQPQVAVHQVSSAGWNLEEDLAFYATAGIDAVGLWLRKLRSHGLGAAVERIRASGITVTSLLTGNHVDVAAPAGWDGQRRPLLEAVDVAARVGAPTLAVTTGPAGGLLFEDAAARLTDALGPVVAAGRNAGVAVALEHTNQLRTDLSFACTFRAAVDLAERLDAAVCMETTACWSEPGLAASAARAGERLRAVHVSDVVAGTTVSAQRAVPGDGDIPLRAVLAAVRESGFAGPFELEMVGSRIETEGYAPAIRRGMNALRALLRP